MKIDNLKINKRVSKILPVKMTINRKSSDKKDSNPDFSNSENFRKVLEREEEKLKEDVKIYENKRY